MYRPLTKETAPMTVIEQMLIPAVYSGSGVSQNSATLDLGADGTGWGSGLIIVEVGNSPEILADGLYIELILEHSDTDAVGAAVTSDDLIVNSFTDATTGQFALINAPAEDSTVFTVEYKANNPNAKRYINVKINLVGNHGTGTAISITGIKYHPETKDSDGL